MLDVTHNITNYILYIRRRNGGLVACQQPRAALRQVTIGIGRRDGLTSAHVIAAFYAAFSRFSYIVQLPDLMQFSVRRHRTAAAAQKDTNIRRLPYAISVLLLLLSQSTGDERNAPSGLRTERPHGGGRVVFDLSLSRVLCGEHTDRRKKNAGVIDRSSSSLCVSVFNGVSDRDERARFCANSSRPALTRTHIKWQSSSTGVRRRRRLASIALYRLQRYLRAR